MRDVNGQSNPLLPGYGRGSASGAGGMPNVLLPQRRSIGLPIALGISTAAIALAGFLVLTELNGDSDSDLPPASTPLEVAKSPVEASTGSLSRPAEPDRVPALASSLAAAPSASGLAASRELPSAAPAPEPAARAQAQGQLDMATPDQGRLPAPSVVASAGPVTALPSSLPPAAAPKPASLPVASAPTVSAPIVSAPAPASAAPEVVAAKPRTGPSAAEVTAFVNRARDFIRSGDIAGARLLLERAARGEDGTALLALAETYDPHVLASWGVKGFKASPEKAKALYQKAADRGIASAQERVLALR